MAKKWGDADYKQLQNLQEHLQKLQRVDLDKFCEKCSKELAARLLALVIPVTPEGDYPEDSGKNGGTLRRGWTASSEKEAMHGALFDGNESSVHAYAKSLPIEKSGDYYIIRIINPVKYASYVEFGHRQEPGRYVPAIGKRLKAGWVNGQYFLTLSEKKLEQLAPAVLERKLNNLFRKVFNG